MALYSRNEGFKIKITECKRDTLMNDKGEVIENYFIAAVWDDERLSTKLNGQRCWGHRLEKAIHVLKADGGQAEIIEACINFINKV